MRKARSSPHCSRVRKMAISCAVVFLKGPGAETHGLNPFYPDQTEETVGFEDEHDNHNHERKYLSQPAARQ